MPRRSWRYLLILLTVWLLILGYMGWHLFVLVEDSNRNQVALDRKERHVELLKTQNQKLKAIVAEMQSQKDELEFKVSAKEKKLRATLKRIVADRKLAEQQPAVAAAKIGKKQLSSDQDLTTVSCSPSLEYEKTTRRTKNEVRELFYYLSGEITKINKKADIGVKKRLTHMLTNIEVLHHSITNNMEKLNSLDGRSQFHLEEHSDLSTTVQRRLNELQNPKHCSAAKKLVCQMNKGCGYGCQAHHVLYCFIVAYGMQRTLVIDSTGWRYSARGWTGIFRPVSQNCESYKGYLTNFGEKSSSEQNILLPIVDSLYPRPPYMPLAIPEDLSERLSKLHGQPFIWWIGQFTKYLFQYSPNVQKEIDRKREKMGFKSPIVGIQVRRTDKINTEAAYHSIEEYMYWVELYYKRLSMKQTIDKKRVFIATDDPSVLPEAERKYKDYVFISDVGITISAGLGSRYSDSSLHGVIFDIQMLSECDFIVCTFSSQVCRLGYEMMQARHPDASSLYQSLDDVYYFGGQSSHNVRAVHPHTAQNSEEISLEIGDLIGIAGNHWDGYSKGTNHRTGEIGLYPSWKAEEVIETAKFPTYDKSQ